MKKLLWLSLGLMPLPAAAFVTADETLVRSNQTILIESYGDKADITVTQTYVNTGSETNTMETLWPTGLLTQPPTVFWNSAELVLEVLDEERARQTIFNQAKAYNQVAWLGAAAGSFEQWWQTESFTLEPGATGVLKIQFQASLPESHDVYLGQLWTADGRPTQNLTVNLVRAPVPAVLLSPMGTWVEEKTNEAWAQQWEAFDYTFTDNFHWLSSDNPEAQISFGYLGQFYQAQFKTLESILPQRTVIVVDRSGSVFGARLERLKQAFRTVLETLPEGAEFKLALAGSELEWWQEDWRVNNRDNQRDAITLIEGVQAQGVTDWEAIISGVNLEARSTKERYNLVYLGDFSDIPPNMQQRLANAGWRALVIDFWQSSSSRLAAWWERYDGQYVPLFNSGFELVEADSIRGAWRDLQRQWPIRNEIDSVSTDWVEPFLMVPHGNNFAMGQVPSSEVAASVPYLPRWWAQLKIADYLRQHEGLPLNEAQIQAVLSIAHSFGVRVFGLDGKADFVALKDKLEALGTDELWIEIQRLHAKPYEADLRYVQGRPFYFVEGQWQPFDIASYQTRGERVTLQLWSEAHRALFLQQADLLAQAMSFGSHTAFCGGQRCATIAPEGRAEGQATDTLLWDKDFDHWALPFWADLVWAEVLDETTYDIARWSEPVSRGQFLVWLQAQMSPQAILPAVNQEIFSDIASSNVGAAQALWFHDQGLFRGYSDGTARLGEPLRRIEGLKLLMQVHGLDSRDIVGNFDEKIPFTDLVGWTQPWGYEAYLRGLVRGYEDKTFRPFQSLTQAEAFKLLVEAKSRLGN